jgi:hypothetical protein
MSDLASSLVRSPKSKERCVNAILSAESNIEDAGLAHYRDSGFVQVILCDMYGMALLSHSLLIAFVQGTNMPRDDCSSKGGGRGCVLDVFGLSPA